MQKIGCYGRNSRGKNKTKNIPRSTVIGENKIFDEKSMAKKFYNSFLLRLNLTELSKLQIKKRGFN